MELGKLDLTDNQIQFLAGQGISFNFDAMSDDDFVDLEEQVGNVLIFDGLTNIGDDNMIGKQAREILDMLV